MFAVYFGPVLIVAALFVLGGVARDLLKVLRYLFEKTAGQVSKRDESDNHE